MAGVQIRGCGFQGVPFAITENVTVPEMPVPLSESFGLQSKGAGPSFLCSEMTLPQKATPASRHAWLVALTRLSMRRPHLVAAIAVVVAAAAWLYASNLRIEGSFVALLPSDSPTAQRFKETMSRRSDGSSTLIVLARSDDAQKNRLFVDELAAKLSELPKNQIKAVEKGPGEAREFFDKWRWLYASRHELALLDCEIGREIDKRKPGFLDLDDPCEETIDVPEMVGEVDLLSHATPKKPAKLPSNNPPLEASRKVAGESELQKYERKLEKKLEALDRYPSGYFQNADGTIFSIMIRASSAGMGEFKSDQLFARVNSTVASLSPKARGIDVGFAGDIPNAIEQRNALISDMAVISLIAVGLILASIIIFFRSFAALFQIGFCVAVGCGLAFAVAMLAYGRLNTATSFLGAIIAGNGINYGIIYLARYRELRKAGTEREQALIEAALSSRKGTFLAAVAAGGAYGALLLTSFRGFSEFGLIGGIGMIFCWIATFSILPALITLVEARSEDPDASFRPTISFPLGAFGRFVQRRRRWVLLLFFTISAAAVVPLPGYLKDPWEYNFSRLGSSSSKKAGAGRWSKKANKIYGSRGSPMLVLADDVEGVTDLRLQLLAADQKVTGGKYIERIDTIHDRLGGPPNVVLDKLQTLSAIRKKVDRVLPRLEGEDREIVKKWRPPDYLRAISADDLPDLIRAQFTEIDGKTGTPLYVYLNRGLSQSNGHNLLRISEIFDEARLPSGRVAPNASRSTVFAAMIRAMERDGPFSTLAAFLAVVFVTFLVTRRFLTGLSIIASLVCGVLLTVGGAAWLDVRLNFLNFVALPLTFGIGVEYAINLYERIRDHDSVPDGLNSIGGPVALCSLTTIIGYGALTMADNMALQSFGRYAMAGELACIITALLVMPAFISLRGGYSKGSAARL
jgi:predicted RND superfamily exporter protein